MEQLIIEIYIYEFFCLFFKDMNKKWSYCVCHTRKTKRNKTKTWRKESKKKLQSTLCTHALHRPRIRYWLKTEDWGLGIGNWKKKIL